MYPFDRPFDKPFVELRRHLTRDRDRPVAGISYTIQSDPMILGIGYLPRSTGPHFWQKFDAKEIEDDLAHIAALGFQAVRVPLFWADFQPSIDRTDPLVFDRLGHFLQLAHDQGLQVQAGLWAGMWDGALWWPDWGVTPAPLPPNWPLLVNGQWVHWGRIRSPFTDQRMLNARDLLIKELVTFYAEHPALQSWETLPGFGRLAAAAGRSAALDWLESTATALRAAAPSIPSTVLHAIDALETSTSVWPDDVRAAGIQPSLSLATLASDRRRLPLNLRWIAFAIDLAAGLAGAPVVLHLAGLPTAPAGAKGIARDSIYYANEEEGAAHLAGVIALARQRRCPALWLWRWAAIPENRRDPPPYDHPNWRRYTGLLRADGQEKRVVEALRQPSTAAKVLPPFEFDPAEYRQDPTLHFTRLWRAYDQATQGM